MQDGNRATPSRRMICTPFRLLLALVVLAAFSDPRFAVAQRDHNCELSTLFVHLSEIQDGCCTEGTCRSTQYPDEDDPCDRACAELFEPFWNDCGEMLYRMRVDGTRGMAVFYDTCLSTLYPPGQCIDECTAAMMHCRLVEVQSACCSDARNCPDNSPVPRACTVQCALVFPALVNSCAEELNADGVDIDQFRSFAEECMRQDGPALVEYAHDLVRQGCAIDLAAPQDRGRRAQDDQASAQKTGIAKLLQTNENTCSWDSFDDRVVEMSAVCCGSNADEACADGQPPRECSPECAVYFHTFYSNCQTLLSTVLQADFDAYTDFHETCMDEANVELFLIAIKHATCAPLRLLGCSLSHCGGCHDEESCMATSLETTEDSENSCMWVAARETCEVRPPCGPDYCYACNSEETCPTHNVGGDSPSAFMCSLQESRHREGNYGICERGFVAWEGNTPFAPSNSNFVVDIEISGGTKGVLLFGSDFGRHGQNPDWGAQSEDNFVTIEIVDGSVRASFSVCIEQSRANNIAIASVANVRVDDSEAHTIQLRRIAAHAIRLTVDGVSAEGAADTCGTLEETDLFIGGIPPDMFERDTLDAVVNQANNFDGFFDSVRFTIDGQREVDLTPQLPPEWTNSPSVTG